MKICVQTMDFDAGAELRSLSSLAAGIGAVVSFVGTVRELSEGQQLHAMTLEHYPGMTEQALQDIAAEACRRWSLLGCTVIHRVGRLAPTDQIVLVGVASAHRKSAFEACEFIVDLLKTQAPFWKCEHFAHGSRWVDGKEADERAADRWVAPEPLQ